MHFHMRTKSLLILTGAHCSKPANNVFVSHNRHCSSPIHSLWQTLKTSVAAPRWPRSSRVPPWHPPTYPPDELNEDQVMTSFRPPPRRVDFAIFKCCWVIGEGLFSRMTWMRSRCDASAMRLCCDVCCRTIELWELAPFPVSRDCGGSTFCMDGLSWLTLDLNCRH